MGGLYRKFWKGRNKLNHKCWCMHVRANSIATNNAQLILYMVRNRKISFMFIPDNPMVFRVRFVAIGKHGGAREYHATFILIFSKVSLVVYLGCIQGSKRARQGVTNIISVSLALGETRQAKIFVGY